MRSRENYPFIIFAVIFTALFVLFKLHAPKKLPVSVIAVTDVYTSAPFFVADAEKFFEKHGIDPVFIHHDFGKEALATLIQGRADYAVASETPIVHRFLEGHPLSVLATVAISDSNLAMLSTKANLAKKTLKAMRLGYVPGTNSEYFMHLVLLYNSFDPKKAKTVPLRPEEMESALRNGTVDAVFIWEPDAALIAEKIPDAEINHWAGLYLWSWNLVSLRNPSPAHRETSKKILLALDDACRFIRDNPERSMKITAQSLGIEARYLKRIWHPAEFQLAMNQEVVLNFENQIRWMDTLAPKQNLTSFINRSLHIFETSLLREIDPEAVSLVQGGAA